MTAPDLKPCPFCGSEQDDHGDLDHDGYFCTSTNGKIAIGCSRCMCVGAEGGNRAEAVAAWNTRAAPTFTAADLEAAWHIGHMNGCLNIRDHDDFMKAANEAPPADLVDRVRRKGGEGV